MIGIEWLRKAKKSIGIHLGNTSQISIFILNCTLPVILGHYTCMYVYIVPLHNGKGIYNKYI